MPKFEVKKAELPLQDIDAAESQRDQHGDVSGEGVGTSSFPAAPSQPVAAARPLSASNVNVIVSLAPGRPAGDTDGHIQTEEAALTMHQDSQDDTKKNLYLYEEDMKQGMPNVATFLKSVISYHTTYPTEKEAKEAKKRNQKVKLGAVIGVYLPTIQHIFGVLMFVRLAWIVGTMGTLQAFFMVLMCCVTTFVTAISMSAIATNGMVQAGGSYFMISRNLGPECGGAVGICFYLANTFATDLYILGCIEIFLQYMAPELAYFGDIHHNPWNNFRVYGTVVVVLLTLVVAVGVKFVAFFAPFSLCCVIISILSIYVGSFEANADTRDDVRLCLVGDRLMSKPHHMVNMTDNWCSNDTAGILFQRYCTLDNATQSYDCDEYWVNHHNDIQFIPGIPGMASGVIKDNLFSHYLELGEVEPGVQANYDHGEIVSDITTSFVALCAIYFPSVTGIMTGSNMSGDLKDPQKSIPIGTILATLTTSFVYLSFVLLFGATSEGALLRDKFGQSQGGSLLAASICWPTKWLVLVGAFCSTIGAALQCLTSAPRLLQAIARDGIIPFLDVFKVTTKNGEPMRAILLTAVIAELGILIASLDYVAPLIDVCFLMCYGFVNLTCAIQTLLQFPSWRPRFKYYHWTLSILGVSLNLALSIIAGWYYALAAFTIAAFVYKYVEYKGGEQEWGDGITGLSMSAAQRALLKLEEGDPHTKNWRPQLLVLCKLTHDFQPKYRNMVSLASQLKAGKGLTIMAGVLEGDYLQHVEDAQKCKDNMKQILEDDKVKGFTTVMITKNITEGINIFVQTVGLGGLRHNTVVVGWPYGWRTSNEERSWKVFLEAVKVVTAKDLALLVPRNIDNFPSNQEKLNNSIDVWWIVHDGGMLILLSFLLKQHKVWKNCPLRIFTVAQMTDNSIQLKKDLETFLYQLRINAEVFVEEMYDNDISAYTVERTLDMEKRAKMLREIKLGRRGTIQELVDASHMADSGSQTPQGRFSNQSSLRKKQPSSCGSEEVEVEVSSGEEEEDDQQEEGIQIDKGRERVHFTFTPQNPATSRLVDGLKAAKPPVDVSEGEEGEVEEQDRGVEFELPEDDRQREDAHSHKLKRVGSRLMRMHTAIRLNTTIRKKSEDADLVILNFPAPPAKLSAEENYMEYLEALTEGLDRVLMVRGSGKEVVTIYS